jgi:predicted nucleic acid-binding protein
VKVALDTNLLAYAEGVNTRELRDAAVDVIRRLPDEAPVLPVQVIGELFSVLVRKGRRSREEAHKAIAVWCNSYPLVETSTAVMLNAAGLARTHQFDIWDAVILAAASQAGCRLLLSDDMQSGFTWGGVTITNPLLAPRHPLLEALLMPRA